MVQASSVAVWLTPLLTADPTYTERHCASTSAFDKQNYTKMLEFALKISLNFRVCLLPDLGDQWRIDEGMHP
jgi:hypothetical protein